MPRVRVADRDTRGGIGYTVAEAAGIGGGACLLSSSAIRLLAGLRRGCR
jgi:hypothetical protein